MRDSVLGAPCQGLCETATLRERHEGCLLTSSTRKHMMSSGAVEWYSQRRFRLSSAGAIRGYINIRCYRHFKPLPTWGNLSARTVQSQADEWRWDLCVPVPEEHEELWPIGRLCALGASLSQRAEKHQPPAPPAATWGNTLQPFIRGSSSKTSLN